MIRTVALDVDGTLIDPVSAVFGARETWVFADVRPAVAALRRRYRVGVGSNGSAGTARFGMSGLFAFEVYAHVDGVSPKPEPDFYRRLAAAATAAPSEVVYVGDEVFNDVVAAQRAGLWAIWLNRARRRVPEGVFPDGIVTDLVSLPAAIDALERDVLVDQRGAANCRR